MSPKNIDLADVGLDAKPGQRFKGKDCRFSILGIPLGLPNLKDAVGKALESGKGNAMVDEVTYVSNYWFIPGMNH